MSLFTSGANLHVYYESEKGRTVPHHQLFGSGNNIAGLEPIPGCSGVHCCKTTTASSCLGVTPIWLHTIHIIKELKDILVSNLFLIST